MRVEGSEYLKLIYWNTLKHQYLVPFIIETIRKLHEHNYKAIDLFYFLDFEVVRIRIPRPLLHIHPLSTYRCALAPAM